MLTFLAARPALRLAGGILSRPAFTGAVSLRTFWISVPVQLAAATDAKSPSKATPKTKSTTKATSKAETAKAAPAKPKRVATPKELVAPKYDRKLMTPPKAKGLNPYAVFLQPKMKEEYKRLQTVNGASVAASAEWNRLSAAEKEPYAELAKRNKEEYEKQFETWYRGLPKGYFKEINRRRKEKNKLVLHRPKSMRAPPVGGYIYFYQDFLKTNPVNGSVAEAAKAAAQAWKTLPENERDKYNERARQAYEEFQKDHITNKKNQ